MAFPLVSTNGMVNISLGAAPILLKKILSICGVAGVPARYATFNNDV